MWYSIWTQGTSITFEISRVYVCILALPFKKKNKHIGNHHSQILRLWSWTNMYCLKKPGLLSIQPTVHSWAALPVYLARKLAMSSRVKRTHTQMWHGFHFPRYDELSFSKVYNHKNLEPIKNLWIENDKTLPTFNNRGHLYCFGRSRIYSVFPTTPLGDQIIDAEKYHFIEAFQQVKK